MLYILSISLQVAGALLLMINSLSTRRDKVIRRFAGRGIMFKDNNTNTIEYNDDALLETYKEAYLSKFAFFYIAAGYFLGVFSSIDNISKWLVAIAIAIVTILIIILSYFVVGQILKYNKKVNSKITSAELNELGIKPDIENVADEEIKKWFE